MHTPSSRPLPPSKRAVSIFLSILLRNVINEWKINFPILIFRVMIDFVHNFHMFLQTKYGRKKCCLKRCAMFWNKCLRFFCAIYSFLDMVDFVFNSEMGTCEKNNFWIIYYFMLGRLHPPNIKSKPWMHYEIDHISKVNMTKKKKFISKHWTSSWFLAN